MPLFVIFYPFLLCNLFLIFAHDSPISRAFSDSYNQDMHTADCPDKELFAELDADESVLIKEMTDRIKPSPNPGHKFDHVFYIES